MNRQVYEHSNVGMRRWRQAANLILLVVVIVASVWWLLGKLPEPTVFLMDPDRGCQTAGAQQVESGEHPYVDWRATYGPLTFYASYVFRRGLRWGGRE